MTERQKNRKTERQNDRKTERQKDRKTERQVDTKMFHFLCNNNNVWNTVKPVLTATSE
jgi:hypothetical protein